MADKIMVQVKFTEDTECGRYSDALYYTMDDYEALTEEALAAAKKTRVDNWKYAVQHPPAPVELTKEQYEAQLAMQQKMVDDLKAMMIEKGYLTVDGD